MESYKNITDLKNEIRHLQVKKELHEKQLKGIFDEFMESLKPKHILQSTYQGVTSSSKLMEIVIGSVLLVGGGYFVKNLIKKGTSRIFRTLVSIGTQSAITFLATKYKGNIKSIFTGLFDQVLKRQRVDTVSA